MSYKTGKPKSLDEITLQDVLDNPIWEWALDEEGEGEEDQDETWQRPILETANVTNEMYSPTISFKIKGSGIYGSGEYYSDTKELVAISIWKNGKWDVLSSYEGQAPITLVAIPNINGIENVEFECEDLQSEKGIRK